MQVFKMQTESCQIQCPEINPIDYKSVQNLKKKKAKNSGFWTKEEDQKYITFLQKNYTAMLTSQLRNYHNVWVKMTKWIGSRTMIQCKTHHQKMMRKVDQNLEQLIYRWRNPNWKHKRQKKRSNIINKKIRTSVTDEKNPFVIIKTHRKVIIVLDERFIASF